MIKTQRLFRSFLPLLLLVFPLWVQASSLEQGLKAYQNGDYLQARKILTPIAILQKDSLAQYHLGLLYLDGLGGTASTEKALNLFESALKQKNHLAATTLSKIYLSGMGVTIDVDRAIGYMALADEYRPADEPEEECD